MNEVRYKKPNFMVVGAPRSGTTTVYEMLSQHPQVFMSDPKEPHYFAFGGSWPDFRGPGDQDALSQYYLRTWREYVHLFQGAGDAKAVGEASAMYLYSPDAAYSLSRRLPGVKAIAILRNPIDRAYSHFLRMRRLGREPLSDFESALEVERERIRQNWAWSWHYARMGAYASQLRRFIEALGRDRIRIYLYEDLAEDGLNLARDLFQFVGVDPSFTPSIGRTNISGLPQSRVVHKIFEGTFPGKAIVKALLPSGLRRRLKFAVRRANLSKPELSPRVRKRISPAFQQEIVELERLIGRDLSSWKK